MIDLDDLDLSMILDQDIIHNGIYIIGPTVAWLLFLFALVCIFRAVPDAEIRREEGTDD